MTDVNPAPVRRSETSAPVPTGPFGQLGRRAFLAGAAALGAVMTVENVGGTPHAHAEDDGPTPLPLALEWTLDGASEHEDHTDGDFDGGGISYPAEELPTGRALVGGLPFDFPDSYATGEPNWLVPAGQTLDLEPAAYAGIFVLGAAQNGGIDAPCTVTYDDGTEGEVALQLSDWAERPGFGEAIGIAATHRHSADSSSATPRVSIFLQFLPLDPGLTATAITLPEAENGRLIAATALPAIQGAAARPFSVTSTDLFVGTKEAPQQLARVELISVGTAAITAEDPATVTLSGEGISAEQGSVTDLAAGVRTTVEIGVDVEPRPDPGTTVPAEATVSTSAATLTQPADLVIAEPGWTMFMVNHFHYDAVWGNTQAEFTETIADTEENGPAIALTDKFLRRAEEDPDFRFVLAELDYLKPYWAFRPGDRDLMRDLQEEGRLEMVGGSYNEPSPNLTGAELTIRNFVYGMGYQRDVLAGAPESAWMLDVFGHDAQFPGIAADAGLTSNAWARGPYHGAGPGDPHRMQFPTEFDWVSPSGDSLLTHYMPLHYSAGWDMNSAETLDDAQEQIYAVFQDLKIGAATRNCLIPVGSDFTPPNRWVTEIDREWNQRYVWPRFVSATAKDYFDTVRAEVDSGEATLSPQSRDMNPIFTGKDVSYIDTKQANREAETTLAGAEKYATLAALLGARYPTEALDKAWRQLCFNAHHDAITGTESDQVYLDLIAGWREALDLAEAVQAGAQDHLCTLIDTSGGTREDRALVVFNPMSWERTDVCTADVSFPEPGPQGLMLRGADGSRRDPHIERFTRHEDGTLASVRIAFLATVPGTGYATFHLTPHGRRITESSWADAAEDGASEIENEAYLLRVDPARGGAITRLYDKQADREMIRQDAVANELLAYDEYSEGPGDSGNPWVIGQKGGPVATSTEYEAEVRVQTSPIGSRLVISGEFLDCTRRQELTLYTGIDRVDCTTRLDGFSASNRLTRLRFQTAVSGGMPVSETANATLARNHGFPHDDTRNGNTHTLDFPAHNWFEVGSTLRLQVPSGKARAVGVGELVVPAHSDYPDARILVDALIRRGVTATTTLATAPRYGDLAVDSNLPDTRIAVGGPEVNAFTEQVLEAADPGYRSELEQQLATGTARVLVPAAEPFEETWQPGADVRGTLALPVLIIAGADESATREAAEALAADIDAAPVITIDQPENLDGTLGTVEDYGVAVINCGIPSFNVEVGGDAYLNLLRSSTRWPSGAWSDPPRATLPDGSNFQTQHWSHDFHYSLVGHAGDWREGEMVRRGHEVNNPLTSRATGTSAGDLPAVGSMLSVEPSSVVVTALKPRGNAIASQGGSGVDLTEGITLRAYEAHGKATEATIRMHRGLTDPQRSTLLEGDGEVLESTGDAVTLPLQGFAIATVTGQAGMRRDLDPEAPELGPRHEAVQPVYSQYWRHNKGAAPLGYQPVTVRVSPEHPEGDGPYELTVETASEHTEAEATGTLQIVVPEGWSASPEEQEYTLAPGAVETVTVTVDPGVAEDGLYRVATRLSDAQGALEAIAEIRRGEVADDAGELGVFLDVDQIRLLPGQRGTLAVTLSNPASSEVHGEAQLITPYGSWHLSDPAIHGFTVPAGGETTLDVEITADGPVGIGPGEWWAVVKVMYAGRVHFTPAIPLVVTQDPLSIRAGSFAIGVGGTEEVPLEVLNIAAEPLTGQATLEVPEGWTAEPSPQPFGPVGEGETLMLPVQVTAAADAEPGEFMLTATATAGDSSASAGLTARILPDLIEFVPGTPEEDYWVHDPGASITQTGLRFADNDRYWIYRFALPVETTAAMLALTLDNQFLVEVRADEGDWVEVLRETEEIRDGSNSDTFEVDLTEHLGQERVIDVRFSDSFPEDGWGIRLFGVTLEIVR